MPKPKTWSCNACDHEGKTSREHLIHIAISRVTLANRGLSPEEVRRHLQRGRSRDLRYFETIDDDYESLDVAWLNQEIRGLICETCNQTWARQLEEDAGNNLYDFTHLRGRADGPLLRRWACFFAIKLWFGGTRTETIADGVLRPTLSKLAQPDVRVEVPVLVAHVEGSPSVWNFAGSAKGWRGADTPYFAWIIRGVVWIVALAEGSKVVLPIPATPLVSGLGLQDVKRVKQRQLVGLVTALGQDLSAPTDPSDAPRP